MLSFCPHCATTRVLQRKNRLTVEERYGLNRVFHLMLRYREVIQSHRSIKAPLSEYFKMLLEEKILRQTLVHYETSSIFFGVRLIEIFVQDGTPKPVVTIRNTRTL